MLNKTYEKVNELFEQSQGYLSARTLIQNKITTIQIRTLVEEGRIERISHGNYWNLMSGKMKPRHYKMIEACITNKKAVICSLSACYYYGLIKDEPEELFVATARTDRGGMKLKFPVSRHFFSLSAYDEDKKTLNIEGGSIHIYDVDRSVCDCIRLENEIGMDKLKLVLEGYSKYRYKRPKHLLEYADRMRFGRIARKYMQENAVESL